MLGSCSARYPNPTDSALRETASLLQEGWSSLLLNHSLRTVVRQSPASLLFVCLMASSVPAMSPNCKPMLYHLARPFHTAFWTKTKSSSVRIAPCSNKLHRIALYNYTITHGIRMAPLTTTSIQKQKVPEY